VVAEVPAVITPQEDDGVFGETIRVEGIEHLAELRVHVTRGRVVAVDEVTGLLGRHGAFFRHVFVLSQFAPGGRREVGGTFGGFLEFGQLEGRGVVEVPILLRSHKRQMWLQKADGEEEGLVGL